MKRIAILLWVLIFVCSGCRSKTAKPDSIAADSRDVPLTSAQRTELDRRIEDCDATPDEVVPWADVKANAVERLKP